MIKWEKISEREIFKNPVFRISSIECYHSEKKAAHNFFLLSTLDWINVVARTVEGKIIFVKQHRLGTDEITIETPGGLIEDGEGPENTAARELLEETGYRAGSMKLLKKLAANPSIQNNMIYFYFADSCVPFSGQNLDEAEDIEVATLSEEETLSMMDSGEINHTIVTAALCLYFNLIANRTI